MEELTIKTHDFETAKKSLQDFAEQVPEELEIAAVETDGGFLGLGDHKVTGDELNERLGTIQQHLIEIKNMNDRTIKEFGQVYSALEALDRDYIQAILISIKGTEKTSEGIANAQKKIREIINNQKKTLEVLIKFKEEIESYKHLGDIDGIWEDYQKFQNKIALLEESVGEALSIGNRNEEKNQTLEELLDKQQNSIQNLINFSDEISQYEHLRDIDQIWDNVQRNDKELDSLGQYNERVSEQLMDIQEKNEKTNALIIHNKELTDTSISEANERIDTVSLSFTKKIRFAYWIAGCSLGIAVIELLFLLLGVL